MASQRLAVETIVNTPRHCPHPSSRIAAASLFISGLLVGCASTDNASPSAPVLYPNAAYKSMGELAAKQHLFQWTLTLPASSVKP